MSRLKRLKAMKIRKRNKLKTTIKCLSLTLILGFTQVLGTYALFTDSIDDLGNISISLGDLDVYADNGFNNDEISEKENNSITKNFSIRNEGTLKQSLNIQLNLHEIGEEILKNISYTLESNDNKFKTITTNMYELKNQGVNITNFNDKGDLILLPGESLNCKATISIADKDTLNKLSGKSIEFGLNVRAQQVNWNGNGFYDVYVQKNSFRKELGDNQTEAIFGDCPCKNNCTDMNKNPANAFTVSISKLTPEGYYFSSASIDAQWYEDGNNINDPNKQYRIHLSEDGVLNIVPGDGHTTTVDELIKRKLQIQLNYYKGNNQKTYTYILTFTRNGDDSFIANWEKIPNPFNSEISILPEMPQNTEASILPEMTVVPEDIEVPTVSEETVKPDNTEVPIVSEETITPEDTEVPVVPETPQTSENTEVIPPKKDDETTL